MKSHKVYQKALKTNKITREEAENFLSLLYVETRDYIKSKHAYYFNRGMWPIKAKAKGKAQKDPKFILNHCTSNKERNYKPALYRFLQSEKASSHFIVCDDGMILYLVDLDDMAYHATKRAGVVPFPVARALGINDSKWINEPGIEVVGNGNHKMFSYEAFEATIVLQRIIVAYFDYSIKELKSHRFFNPMTRGGDPGALYLLPLVEHAVFSDQDLTHPKYWLWCYKDNPFEVCEKAEAWMSHYKVYDKDEWKDFRKKLTIKSDLLD